MALPGFYAHALASNRGRGVLLWRRYNTLAGARSGAVSWYGQNLIKDDNGDTVGRYDAIEIGLAVKDGKTLRMVETLDRVTLRSYQKEGKTNDNETLPNAETDASGGLASDDSGDSFGVFPADYEWRLSHAGGTTEGTAYPVRLLHSTSTGEWAETEESATYRPKALRYLVLRRNLDNSIPEPQEPPLFNGTNPRNPNDDSDDTLAEWHQSKQFYQELDAMYPPSVWSVTNTLNFVIPGQLGGFVYRVYVRDTALELTPFWIDFGVSSTFVPFNPPAPTMGKTEQGREYSFLTAISGFHEDGHAKTEEEINAELTDPQHVDYSRLTTRTFGQNIYYKKGSAVVVATPGSLIVDFPYAGMVLGGQIDGQDIYPPTEIKREWLKPGWLIKPNGTGGAPALWTYQGWQAKVYVYIEGFDAYDSLTPFATLSLLPDESFYLPPASHIIGEGSAWVVCGRQFFGTEQNGLSGSSSSPFSCIKVEDRPQDEDPEEPEDEDEKERRRKQKVKEIAKNITLVALATLGAIVVAATALEVLAAAGAVAVGTEVVAGVTVAAEALAAEIALLDAELVASEVALAETIAAGNAAITGTITAAGAAATAAAAEVAATGAGATTELLAAAAAADAEAALAGANARLLAEKAVELVLRAGGSL